MKWMAFVLFVVVLAVFSQSVAFGDGAPVQPNHECVEFVFQKEQALGVHNPGKALGDAIRACNTGMQKGCLEYVYEETLKGDRKHSGESRLAWNKAILSCKTLTWRNCLERAHEFWKGKYNEPRALEQAVQSCRNDVRLSCLDYAFQVEAKLRSSDLRAFNGAVTICQKGISGDCLKTLFEQLVPAHFPNQRDEWGTAVRSCSRIN